MSKNQEQGINHAGSLSNTSHDCQDSLNAFQSGDSREHVHLNRSECSYVGRCMYICFVRGNPKLFMAANKLNLEASFIRRRTRRTTKKNRDCASCSVGTEPAQGFSPTPPWAIYRLCGFGGSLLDFWTMDHKLIMR